MFHNTHEKESCEIYVEPSVENASAIWHPHQIYRIDHISRGRPELRCLCHYVILLAEL